MFYGISYQPAKWAELLISFSNPEKQPQGSIEGAEIVQVGQQRKIKLTNRFLNDQTILEISQEIVEKNLPSNLLVLNKIKQGFENFLALQQTKKKQVESTLNSLSARFSRWAQNHSTLAKILVLISFGLFKKFFDEGHQINQQNLDLEKQITQFTSLSKIVQKKIETAFLHAQVMQQVVKIPPKVKAQVEPQPYPKEILDIIFQYLNSDEKRILLRWEKAYQILQKTDDHYKDTLLDPWQKRLKEVLQPAEEFKNELERLDKLTNLINNDKSFNDIITDKRNIIEQEVRKILTLNFNKTKKIILENRDLTLLIIRSRYYLHAKESKWFQERDFVKEALKLNKILKELPDDLRYDKEMIAIAVHYHPACIRDLYAYELSMELVTYAFNQYGSMIEEPDIFLDSFTEEQKANLVLAAVSTHPAAYLKTPRHLLEDVDFILKVVKRNGHAFRYLNEDLKNKKEIIDAALENDPTILELLPYYFKSHRERVMKAVTQNGAALQYASEKLKKDPAICLAAVNSSNEAIKHVQYFDKEIVISALKWRISLRSMNLQNDLLNWLKSIPEPLFNDFDVMFEAVSFDGMCLNLASTSLKNNPTIVLKAVQSHAEALKYASEELKNDKEFVLKAIQANLLCYIYMDKSWRNDHTLTLAAINAIDDPDSWNIWTHISEELKKDPVIIEAYEKKTST